MSYSAKSISYASGSLPASQSFTAAVVTPTKSADYTVDETFNGYAYGYIGCAPIVSSSDYGPVLNAHGGTSTVSSSGSPVVYPAAVNLGGNAIVSAGPIRPIALTCYASNSGDHIRDAALTAEAVASVNGAATPGRLVKHRFKQAGGLRGPSGFAKAVNERQKVARHEGARRAR